MKFKLTDDQRIAYMVQLTAGVLAGPNLGPFMEDTDNSNADAHMYRIAIRAEDIACQCLEEILEQAANYE